MRAVVFRSISVLFSAFLGLALSEALVRVLHPQGLAVPWQDDVDGITAPKPNVHGRHFIPQAFDVTVTFSSQRFRNLQEFRTPPSSDVFRIAMIGDSFTFGFGANDDQTYPAQLEEILNSSFLKRSHYKSVEVINAGNGGTGLGEQALWYDIWVKQFHPHLVVVTCVHNDVSDDLGRQLFRINGDGIALPQTKEQIIAAAAGVKNTRRLVNSMPFYSFLAQRSHLMAFLRNFGSALLAHMREAAIEPEVYSGDEQLEKALYAEKGLPLLKAEVVWLNKQVRESGAKLLVVYAPTAERVSGLKNGKTPWKQEAIVRALVDSCEQNQIPFLDLSYPLSNMAQEMGLVFFYQKNDYHPNPVGYRAMAHSVASFLAERELVQ